VAAPTAGFHFTKRLISQLKKKGVQFEYVTLQVGLGTFAPVKIDDITKHKMHAEWIEVSKKTLANIVKAKSQGRRIIAVGTTSARTLETIANKFSIFRPKADQPRADNFQFPNNFQINKFSKKIKDLKELRAMSCELRDYTGWTNIFIYPGYKFKIVDAMITNFHLPKSTLLMLVSALAGREKILSAYQAAIEKKYRFFSYGDAMLII
jgi:S-adenosylmethionine:tRNA ribosyltransferase-isomerase